MGRELRRNPLGDFVSMSRYVKPGGAVAAGQSAILSPSWHADASDILMHSLDVK